MRDALASNLCLQWRGPTGWVLPLDSWRDQSATVAMGTNSIDPLGELERLTRKQLLERWRELYGKTAPSGARREIMIPFLAYRIQEKAEGGLSVAAQTMLKSAIRQVKRARSPEGGIPRQRMKAGIRVIRRWKGEIHEVDVTETAYQYRDHEYRSLSEVARKITGTRWSGPAFFGLKKLRSDRASNHD
jgi:hypothetical protein